MPVKKAVLVLEDGTTFEGKNFGSEGTAIGESGTGAGYSYD